jgi:hypothetical protein
LTICYVSQGWEVGDYAVRRGPGAAGADQGSFVEVGLARPGRRAGQLWFCEFDQHGALREPPRRAGVARTLQEHETTLRRLWDRLEGKPAPAAAPAGPVYQFQLLVEGYQPLTAAERAQAETLFHEALKAMRQRWQ